MKNKTIVAITLISILAWSIPSYAGYSRSYSTRSYSRPSYRPSYRAPSVINRSTTVIHRDSSPGIGGNPFFWMWMMDRPQQQVAPAYVVPQSQPAIVEQPQQEPTAMIAQSTTDNSWSAWSVFLAMIAFCAAVFAVFSYSRTRSEV